MTEAPETYSVSPPPRASGKKKAAPKTSVEQSEVVSEDDGAERVLDSDEASYLPLTEETFYPDDRSESDSIQTLDDARDSDQGAGAGACQPLPDAEALVHVQLANGDIPLEPGELEKIRWWSDLTEDKLKKLERKEGHDYWRVLAPDIEKTMRFFLEICPDGVYRAPPAMQPTDDDKKHLDLLTDEVWEKLQAEVDEFLSTIKVGEE